MKSTALYVSKSQLLDYVSKREFNDFKEEMRDFRDEMYEFRDYCYKRFASIDKRLNDIERRIDELKEDFRIHTGAILEQMREDSKMMYEYMRSIEAKIVGKE